MSTENYAPPSTPVSKRRGYDLVRVVLGLLLLTASALKAYDLWVNPTLTDTRLLSANLQIAVVEVEAILGLWLLSGIWQGGSWLAALIGFGLLASVSLDFALHKLPCGCLGDVGRRSELSPWWMFAIDLAAVAALWRWPPVEQIRPLGPRLISSNWQPAYLAVLILIFVTGNVVAFVIRSPQGIHQHHIVEELPPIFADPGTKLVHTFTVKNDSDQLQRNLKVTHSCLCTKATIEETELAPGAETQLHLEADLTGRRGAAVFESFVHFESGKIRTYSVKTQVLQRIAFDPRGLHFGLLDPGEKKTRPAHVVMHGGPDGELPQLLSLVPQSVNLTAAWCEDAAQKNSDELCTTRSLAVSVAADVVPGTSSGTVAVRYQLGGREHEAVLPISWTVCTHYEISPPRIFFMWPTESNKELKGSVVVRRLDGRQFAIRAVRATDPFIICTATLNAAAASHELAIVVDIGRERTTIAGEVIVETDDLLQHKLEIPVSVMNRQAGVP
jgi:hypothetical protein